MVLNAQKQMLGDQFNITIVALKEKVILLLLRKRVVQFGVNIILFLMNRDQLNNRVEIKLKSQTVTPERITRNTRGRTKGSAVAGMTGGRLSKNRM